MWSHVECTKAIERERVCLRHLTRELCNRSERWHTQKCDGFFLALSYRSASILLFVCHSFRRNYIFPPLLWHDTMRYNAEHIVCVHFLFFISLHWHTKHLTDVLMRVTRAREYRWHWIRINGANTQMCNCVHSTCSYRFTFAIISLQNGFSLILLSEISSSSRKNRSKNLLDLNGIRNHVTGFIHYAANDVLPTSLFFARYQIRIRIFLDLIRWLANEWIISFCILYGVDEALEPYI